jgi:hypothetical protein
MNSASTTWKRLSQQAPRIGAACLVACAVGAWVSPGAFLRSYLVAYCYWLGITLGSLAIVMIQHLTGGGWGLLIRRILEAATRTLPVLTLLFVPLGASLFWPTIQPGASREVDEASSPNPTREQPGTPRAAELTNRREAGEDGIPTAARLLAPSASPSLLAAATIPSGSVTPARLYPWTEPTADTDPVLRHKRLYLNEPAFLGRAVVYFALWGVLVYPLNRWSRRQEDTGDPRWSARMRLLSGPGLVLYGLSITFAAIDWVMSLQPHWFSTIFAVIFAMAQALAAMSFAIAVLSILAAQPPLAALITPARLRDLGNLLLMFVMLWTYTAFAQFLLTWAGNLPAEIVWYVPRTRGGWQWLAAGLLLCQFALPFLFLLFRNVKDQLRHLVWVARLILVTCFLNLFWQIVPAFPPGELWGHGLDFLAAVLALAGIGGIWMGWFLRQLNCLPLVARHDSGLVELATHG